MSTTLRQRVVDRAREALAAYEARFGSTKGEGNYVGPIDEEMIALRRALQALGGSETAQRALAGNGSQP